MFITHLPQETSLPRPLTTLTNDLNLISEWLGADSDSLSGEDTNLGDAAFRMVGYLRVDEPGEWTFTTTSDDGSVVYVNGHGSMTVTGTIDLPESGYYPIDVRYFNGDWTNDTGDHGGANFAGDEGFEDVVSRLAGHSGGFARALLVG